MYYSKRLISNIYSRVNELVRCMHVSVRTCEGVSVDVSSELKRYQPVLTLFSIITVLYSPAITQGINYNPNAYTNEYS